MSRAIRSRLIRTCDGASSIDPDDIAQDIVISILEGGRDHPAPVTGEEEKAMVLHHSRAIRRQLDRKFHASVECTPDGSAVGTVTAPVEADEDCEEVVCRRRRRLEKVSQLVAELPPGQRDAILASYWGTPPTKKDDPARYTRINTARHKAIRSMRECVADLA